MQKQIRMVWAAAAALAFAAALAGCGESIDEGLASADVKRRVEALNRLGDQDSEQAVEKAAEHVSDADDTVAVAAVRAIGRSRRNKQRTVRVLTQVIREEKRPEVRREAIVQLARQPEPEPETLDDFRRLAQTDPDPEVRARAMKVVGERGDPWQDGPMLMELAKKAGNLQVESAAVGAVSKLVKVGVEYDPSAGSDERAKALWRMEYWMKRILQSPDFRAKWEKAHGGSRS